MFVLVVISYLAAYACGNTGCPTIMMHDFADEYSCNLAKQYVEAKGFIGQCVRK
jgi:hypothetical protein